MTIEEILTEKNANLYDRHWDKEKNLWVYSHREKLGLSEKDGNVIHHVDGDHSNNNKKNLQSLTRAEHCSVENPAKKYDGCKIKGCSNDHFCHGYCSKHYFRKLRNKK